MCAVIDLILQALAVAVTPQAKSRIPSPDGEIRGRGSVSASSDRKRVPSPLLEGSQPLEKPKPKASSDAKRKTVVDIGKMPPSKRRRLVDSLTNIESATSTFMLCLASSETHRNYREQSIGGHLKKLELALEHEDGLVTLNAAMGLEELTSVFLKMENEKIY